MDDKCHVNRPKEQRGPTSEAYKKPTTAMGFSTLHCMRGLPGNQISRQNRYRGFYRIYNVAYSGFSPSYMKTPFVLSYLLISPSFCSLHNRYRGKCLKIETVASVHTRVIACSCMIACRRVAVASDGGSLTWRSWRGHVILVFLFLFMCLVYHDIISKKKFLANMVSENQP